MGLFESRFLKLFGLALIFLTIYFLFKDAITSATVSAAVGLLLTFLSRFSQFKRFKGWGFEAEMWEEKQEEAERLVESLKAVAALTAREVMLQSIKNGRWDDGKSWSDRWKLFDEIKSAQSGLLNPESARQIKKSVDRWFLHDIALTEFGKLQEIVNEGAETAKSRIREQHGNPILDMNGFKADMKIVQEVCRSAGGLFELAGQEPLIESVENWWRNACAVFQKFDVPLEIPSEVRAKLDFYSALESLPEMPVTPDLIAAADR